MTTQEELGAALGERVLVAIKGYIARALRPLESTQRDLLARLDQSAAMVESLERRASRHAEHLSRLESRLKNVEHGRDAP